MKRAYAILLVVFVVGGLCFASAALAESLSASIQIGEETVPLDLRPVYDQKGNIASYSFNLERSDGAISGEMKLDPPIKGGNEGLLQQDGEEICRYNFLAIMGAISGESPTNLHFQYWIF